MKKTTLILAACLIFAGTTFAQKYGHVNSAEVMKNMPGIDSIQIKLMEFQQNLQIYYENLANELQAKRDKFDKEAGTMSASVRKSREDELVGLQNRMQEFGLNAQDEVEQEQARLVAPFQEKIKNAINEVAKENKFTYILDTMILLYYDGGDDITPLVKKKLGIK